MTIMFDKKLKFNLWPCGLLAITIISFSSTLARADDDDVAASTNSEKRPIEELFKTDVVFPEEKGELELELASVYQNHAGDDTWTIPLSLEYGLGLPRKNGQ
jgi:hypothetical protein